MANVYFSSLWAQYFTGTCPFCPLRDGTANTGEERRGIRGMAGVGLAEFYEGLSLFAPRQSDGHRDQDGEHHQGREGRPLEEEAEHD
jgi:hypothetical protein